MKAARRAATLLLLLLSLGLCAWWVVHVPYRPGLLMESVPANASFVMLATNPAARWDEWAASPPLKILAESAGIGAAALEELGRDPEARGWIDRLGARDVVLGYCPSLGYSGRPAWFMASWIGGYSQRLRWMIRLNRSRGLISVGKGMPLAFWACRPKWVERGSFLSFALRDGMILACVSPDPNAVRYMLEASDGSPLVPSAVSAGLEREARVMRPAGGGEGWGWVRLGATRPRPLPPTVFFSFDALAPDRLDLRLRGEWTSGGGGPLPPFRGEEAVRLAALGEAWALVPLEALRGYATGPGSPAWLGPVAEFLDAMAAEGGGGVLVAVCGGDYGGRIRSLFGGAISDTIKGLKVPTLAAAIEIADGSACGERLGRLLDKLNARYSLRLVPREAGWVGYARLFAIEGTGDGLYSRFEADEHVALAVADGWMLAGSSLAALRELAAAIQTGAAGEGRSGVPASGPAAAMSVDFDRFGSTARNTMAAASLALLMRGADGSAAARARLAEASAWIEGLAPLGACEATLTVTGRIAEAHLQAGRPAR